ncbi:MAG TPA: hypothetical protein VMK66_03735 [Myxococcales bacterium]|nr:hypothetical protein [Myxococcales bacterium]
MRLFALIFLLAQEGLPPVPPRMPVDEEPSAAACTFEIALRGAACTYEASGAPADPRDASGAALEAGRQACASAAHGDAGLRAECERFVAAASASAACASRSRLLDARGRLTPEARPCAEALREEIARTSRAATLSPGCCSCLAEARCAVPVTQCKREIADLAPGAALRSCMVKSCHDSCSFAAPAAPRPVPVPEEPPTPAALPEDPKNPRKI